MAQSGYTPIVLFNSGTSGNQPTTSNLQVGELAINYADGKLYYNNGTTIALLASSSATGTVTSVGATVPSFLSISGSPVTSSGTLAIGYSGTPLPIANGGTNTSATPTNGGAVYGTGTAYAVTPAGTTGQVLTSTGSGAPIWSGAGALKLISTQTASNSASIQFTGLNSYNSYFLTFSGVYINSGFSQALVMQVGNGSGPTYNSSGYNYIALNTSGGGSNIYYQVSDNYFNLSVSTQSSSTSYPGTHGNLRLSNLLSGYFSYEGTIASSNSTSVSISTNAGSLNTTQTTTAIQLFYPGTGVTIASGTFSLYAITT